MPWVIRWKSGILSPEQLPFGDKSDWNLWGMMYVVDKICGKIFTFDIPMSVFSALGHTLKLYNCLPANMVEVLTKERM